MADIFAKVSATEANREFSKVLDRVVAGEIVAITKQGKVVATISPAKDKDEAWEERRKAFIKRLRSQPMINIPRGTRDELYED